MEELQVEEERGERKLTGGRASQQETGNVPVKNKMYKKVGEE